MAHIKYIVKGIKEPGKVNVRLNGKFRTIELYTASQEVLEELYKDACPYVDLSPTEKFKASGVKPIVVKSITGKKSKR